MITFALDDLITPLTRDQVKTSIYDALAVLGVSTTSWKPGAVVRAMITATAVVLAALSSLIALIARAGFLDLSADNWLTLVAHYVYGIDRFPAEFATGEITVNNSGGGDYTLDAGDLIVINSATSKTYRNSVLVHIGPLAAGVAVAIEAIEAGSASTATPGQINSLVTPLLGLTCTNALAVVGQDEETDPALITRCREQLGALSPMGPQDAYAAAVRNALRADGTSIGVTRIRTRNDGAGNVYVWVATPTGEVLGDPNDPATDLGVLNDAVEENAGPLGVTVILDTAVPVAVPITYELWCYNTIGLSATQLEALIATALANYLSTQPIGGNVIDPDVGKIFADKLKAIIESIRDEIFHVELTVPAGDVSLGSDEVPVLGLVTPTAIHQVALKAL